MSEGTRLLLSFAFVIGGVIFAIKYYDSKNSLLRFFAIILGFVFLVLIFLTLPSRPN